MIWVVDALIKSILSLSLFKVSKNFAEVFKALVPDGQGQLVMKRSFDVVSCDLTCLCVCVRSCIYNVLCYAGVLCVCVCVWLCAGW